MNQNQIVSLIQSVLTIGGGYFVAQGILDKSQAEAIGAGIVALMTVLLAHQWHGGNANPPGRAALWLLAVALAVSFGCGCTSIINTPQGKVVSITERGIGFHIQSTATQTETPDVVFGFWSSAVVFAPTSTNGPLFTPDFANTFGYNQTGFLDLGISEQIAGGHDATLLPGGTNSATVILPVVPK